MATDPLTVVADELYALTPTEFTAARNSRAKETSNRELAANIRALRKPSPAAWVANALVRYRAGEIDDALALGASMREAQDDLDRDTLSTLSRQRRQLVAAVAQDGGKLAASLGQTVSAGVLDEVGQTLQAAMTDPDAAEALKTGRLLRSLATVGFEPVDLEDAVAVGGTPARAVRSVPQPADTTNAASNAKAKATLARATREAKAAKDRADAAGAVLEEIDRRTDDASVRRDELTEDLADLRHRVKDVEHELAAIDRGMRAAARERPLASSAAERAERDAKRASDRLDRLD